MNERLVDKVFSFLVESAGEQINKKFDIDKNVKLIHGILLSSNKPQFLFYRGSQRIEINGDELFPADYESKLLMSGISIPPDERFRSLGNGVVTGNGELKIQYTDTDNPMAGFDPYKVIIILKCEMK